MFCVESGFLLKKEIKKFLYSTFIFFPFLFFGQSQMEKIIVNPLIQTIQINAKYIFKLEVTTHSKEEIKIRCHLEGEYKRNFDVYFHEEETHLHLDIKPHILAFFPEDKLGVHKVIVITAQLTLPKNKSLEIKGGYTNIFAEGIYKSLKVGLQNGNCFMKNILGTMSIFTQKGDIHYAGTTKGLKAISNYGKIQGMFNKPKEYHMELKTITGNIFINQKIK